MNLSSPSQHHSLRLVTPRVQPSSLSSLRSRQVRRLCRKRRRIKFSVRSDSNFNLGFSFDNLFHSLLSQFPSPNSLRALGPALGLFSGLALYASRFAPPLLPVDGDEFSCIGNWVLFSSPSAFNRFVLLRCPSISFEGSDLLEDVNEKLVKEDRHFVRLDSGRIQASRRSWGKGNGENEMEEELEYQRVCVSTEDGGVLSLDWPANLDLRGEHGLDSTLLLVPGTVEGSMERRIRFFVCEALKHGFFPVVMNPRGCGGSPLTTARLFTAADSDDICTAIQFINKARPWTTMMGIGLGYGANMLTKYLAEVGERTPLTAATCIDNPFDLEEATRSYPHHIALDQKLANGLVDILQSNKKLFKGRAKGFDVEKALSATSVRDFEKAISMVSYGFEAIEDFYSESSTGGVVGNIKIPVLFIQNEVGAVPQFSIPRSSIAENPFTSLLLCSCLTSRVIAGGTTAESWCQNVTIEWLSAVELGLLKGRHPLLKDLDVTINPSGALSIAEGRVMEKGVKGNKLVDLVQKDTSNGYSLEPSKENFEDSYSESQFHLRSGQLSQRNLELDDNKELQVVDDGAMHPASSVETDIVKEEEPSPDDDDRGQVLQTAQVVLNMLDVTLPGTLTEEQKKKVLVGVGQGETLVKALQDAVPEDVRGKLMTSVSGILHAENANLKLDGLLGIGKLPNVTSELKTKVQEKIGELSSSEGLHKDASRADQVQRVEALAESCGIIQPGLDKPAGRVESEVQPSENFQKSADAGQSPSVSSHQGDISSSERKGNNESANNHETDVLSKVKAAPHSDPTEKESETGMSSNLTNQSEKGGGTEEATVKEDKVEQDGGVSQLEPKPENNQRIGERKLDSSSDQSKTASANVDEEAVSPPGSSSEAQGMEKEESDEKVETKSLQPAVNQNKGTSADPVSPTFGVSDAFNALTGMDDSTQLAVTSVFGVIENMIDHLEGKSDETEVKEKNEVNDDKIDCSPDKQIIGSDHTPGKKEDNQSELIAQSHTSHDPSVDTRKPLADYLVKVGYVNNIPLHVPVNLNRNSAQNEYLHKDLSKMPANKPLDLETTALLLDYFPEEGQWKLLEQPGNVGDSINDVLTSKGASKEVQGYSFKNVNDADSFIEPPYVISDKDKQQELFTGDEMDSMNENDEEASAELIAFVKKIILDSLMVEVDRRLGPHDQKEMESDLARDLERVATDVSLAIVHDEGLNWCLDRKHYHGDFISQNILTLHRENTVRAISTALQGTSYLRRVLPVGVVVGSSLAALREYFNVSTKHDSDQTEHVIDNLTKKSGERKHNKASLAESKQMHTDNNVRVVGGEGGKLENFNNNNVMVGAVTAALGASALMVQQSGLCNGQDTAESTSEAFEEKGNQKELAMSEKNQSNIVTSFAEKAMSVASPVVPTKEGGEVDQERLVAMLADLGQRGGLLKLVGKIALLWGGLRGAMSLTERIISFLHLADRPLLQRILGFVGMVLVLWSPVFVPLLPTIVQSWASNCPSKMAEFASIVGLYTAVMILVMLWGRRVRGHENSLEQYGLDIISLRKVQDFLKGLIAGGMLVLLIQSLNAVLGCVSFSSPSSVTSFSTAVAWFKVYGKIIMLACQGTVTATAIVLVEELLFRSWLPEEIATDLGYHEGIIISGLAFALSQRSPQAIPGLWLLSLALAGLRQRCQGSLSVPIGLRTGIMASSYVLQKGGFLTYKPNFPLWITGTHPFQPFSGVVGLAFSLVLAAILYPRQPLQCKNLAKEH